MKEEERHRIARRCPGVRSTGRQPRQTVMIAATARLATRATGGLGNLFGSRAAASTNPPNAPAPGSAQPPSGQSQEGLLGERSRENFPGATLLWRLRSRSFYRDREMLWGGRRGNGNFVAASNRWSAAMPQPNDLSRSLVALDQDSTIIAVIELSQSSWPVAGVLPGIERQPRKKLEPSLERLLAVLHRWRDEAVGAGRTMTRIALAFEAGRDGFWLARWLEARGVEAHVIHASSVAVSREHRRAKTDRLDTELLKRGFRGWLRGERGHCSMARVPTIAEEDAKRPNRERECLVRERTRLVNRIKATLARLGVRNFKPTLRGPAPAKAGGGRASCNGAHPGGHAAAAKCLGRAAARHGAAGLCGQPDQGDRGSSSETIEAGA